MTKKGKAYLFNHEGRTAICLRNSLSIVTVLLQYSCQHSCQQNAGILKFLSPMHFIHLTLLPIHSNEKVSHSLKIAEDNLVSYAPQPDLKRQKLLEYILTRNSKLYLGKVYTKERVNDLSDEEVDKLFSNYKAKLSGQMVNSLGKSIINMCLMGACAVLGISDQDALSEDLESDPFLNSALQRFTCELYNRFGSFLAPLSIGFITSRHYLSKCNKNGGDNNSEEGAAKNSE